MKNLEMNPWNYNDEAAGACGGDDGAPVPCELNVDCQPPREECRRRRFPPEIQPRILLSKKKNAPSREPTPGVIRDDSVKIVFNQDETKIMNNMLDALCEEGEIPQSTPENAPFDLVLDFMSAVVKEDYEVALQLAKKLLEYEPTNTTIQDYVPVLEELIKLEEESETSCSSDSDDSESCTSEESKLSEVSNVTSEEDEAGKSEDDDDDDDSRESSNSFSTVSSSEYLSEYGEEYENPQLPIDDGYETNSGNQEDLGEQEEEVE